MDLSGKVALVTGSSRGIGREIARGLAEKGSRIAVHYRADRGAAMETLSSLTGGPHAVFGADVADPNSARILVEGVAREMGGVDVLVNNAAVFEAHPVPEVDYDAWQDAWSRTIATNLIGPANLSFLAAHVMMERGGGRVVNVSSRGAFRGEPDHPAYGASKAGMISLAQSLARALGSRGIAVNAVAPGFVETEMTADLPEDKQTEYERAIPLGRFTTSDEVAGVVRWLASEEAGYITGAVIPVDGGLGMGH